jgi:hypothetical protein
MFNKKNFCGEFRNENSWVGNVYKIGQDQFVIHGLDQNNKPFTSAPFKGTDFKSCGTSFCGAKDYQAA